MKHLCLSVIITFLCCQLTAQSGKTKYTSDFKFKDGIYLSLDDFKSNTPSIDKNAIVSRQSLQGQVAEEVVLTAILPPILNDIKANPGKDFLRYMDADGKSHQLKRTEVWGYCSNGAIYKLVSNQFHRVFKIGAIMYFAAATHAKKATGSGDLRQYMINFETGRLWKYNLENFEGLLKRDKELYTEFAAIKGKGKRRKQMFIYLNKYNERNPIYF